MEIAARVVGALGTVLPATSEIVTLVAEFDDGRVLSGERRLRRRAGASRACRCSRSVPVSCPETCEVIPNADVIVVGPGSLFTSILPPLLVPQVAAAIRRSDAVRVLVANLMTEPGETDDYSVLEHC